MAILLKGARALDPQVGLDAVADVIIDEGKIAEVSVESLDPQAGFNGVPFEEIIECEGKMLVPGLVDVHVHLREPGFEAKEDVASGTRAAVHGGFTDVCAMPNTNPVTDSAMIVEFVQARAKTDGVCKVHVSGACTQGLKGESLSEMGDMVAHGVVAFTDDGRGVQTAGMMSRVMKYASQFGRVVMSHCQDESLVGDGQINSGPVATKLGLAGWPAAGEEVQIARDIAMCRMSKCPLHIQHITTAHGLDLVRAAKAEGLPVTCEATPHHMFLDETYIDTDYNTYYKVNPPLRKKSDAAALVAGIADGSVDVIATDHAPHTEYEKDREFELAPFGMIGLETALGLVITKLVKTGTIDWNRMVELMAVNPRALLRLEPVRLEQGSTADLTLFDPEAVWTVDPVDFQSRAQNSGFIGWELTGKATDVFVDGIARMREGVVCE